LGPRASLITLGALVVLVIIALWLTFTGVALGLRGVKGAEPIKLELVPTHMMVDIPASEVEAYRYGVPESPDIKPDVTFEIILKTSVFEPNEIRVKKGQIVKLVLIAADNGIETALGKGSRFRGHGFYLWYPYNIWVTLDKETSPIEVWFVAHTEGEFVFECTVLCDPVKHPFMKGKLIVE
jgi:heme/copper-type cytochrome/quinol oxidase subunit 2